MVCRADSIVDDNKDKLYTQYTPLLNWKATICVPY